MDIFAVAISCVALCVSVCAFIMAVRRKEHGRK